MLIKEIADRIDVHKNTIKNWVAQYKDWMTTPLAPGETLDLNDRDTRLIVWIASLRAKDISPEEIKNTLTEHQASHKDWPMPPEKFYGTPASYADAIETLQRTQQAAHDMTVMVARNADLTEMLQTERNQRLADAHAYASNLSMFLARSAQLLDTQSHDQRQTIARLTAQLGMVYAYLRQTNDMLEETRDKLHAQETETHRTDAKLTEMAKSRDAEKTRADTLSQALIQSEQDMRTLKRQRHIGEILKQIILTERQAHEEKMQLLNQMLTDAQHAPPSPKARPPTQQGPTG